MWYRVCMREKGGVYMREHESDGMRGAGENTCGTGARCDLLQDLASTRPMTRSAATRQVGGHEGAE